MVAKDIAKYLQDQGVATEGVNMFCYEMPAEPDTCLAIMETDGGEPDGFLDYPGVLIRARAKSADDARQLCQNIQNALNFKGNLDINGHWYLIIKAQGVPVPQGRDENGRMEFNQHYNIIMERVS